MIRPLNDWLVVRRIEGKTKTDGGLFIPDAAKEKPRTAKVLAVGPGLVLASGHRVVPGVAVGEYVVFGAYVGTEVKVGEEEYLMVRESEVLGVTAEADLC